MNANHVIAAPYCAKCKRQVQAVRVAHNPMKQEHTLLYMCHGVATSMTISHLELVSLTPHNTIIDFTEFSRIPDDGQNLPA